MVGGGDGVGGGAGSSPSVAEFGAEEGTVLVNFPPSERGPLLRLILLMPGPSPGNPSVELNT